MISIGGSPLLMSPDDAAKFIQMHMNFESGTPDADRLTELVRQVMQPAADRIAELEKALMCHRALVRELDVAINGEAGAAELASLCDLVAQVRDIAARLAASKRRISDL